MDQGHVCAHRATRSSCAARAINWVCSARAACILVPSYAHLPMRCAVPLPCPPFNRSYGASAGAELAAELSTVERAVHDALAAALEVRWPVSRWPIYVFTGVVLCFAVLCCAGCMCGQPLADLCVHRWAAVVGCMCCAVRDWLQLFMLPLCHLPQVRQPISSHCTHSSSPCSRRHGVHAHLRWWLYLAAASPSADSSAPPSNSILVAAGAMVCLLTSATCHLFGCCAAHVTAVLWRFDYAGIAVLIVASFFPPVYYGERLSVSKPCCLASWVRFG